jgi:hypothetical protein
MKKILGALILGGLLSTGMLALSSEKPDHPVPSVSIGEAKQAASSISIDDVLRAHNVPRTPDSLAIFSAEAVRLTTRPHGIDRELPSFFERRVSIVLAGNAYKRHTADPLKLREQYDMFDGSVPYHAVTERGRLIEEANQMAGSQSGDVEFSVKTFGLVPILKQLSDPTMEAVYLGRAVGSQDKFDIRTATDRWTLYADTEHLIRRVEISDKTIEYASYRSVDGVQLPFIQRVSIGSQPFQELVFTQITLHPKLPSGFFSVEAFAKEIAH